MKSVKKFYAQRNDNVYREQAVLS